MFQFLFLPAMNFMFLRMLKIDADIMQEEMEVKKNMAKVDVERLPQFVYGLKGISELFNVSKTTALKYKNIFLKDAVFQRGNVIVVDTEKAIKLFAEE